MWECLAARWSQTSDLAICYLYKQYYYKYFYHYYTATSSTSTSPALGAKVWSAPRWSGCGSLGDTVRLFTRPETKQVIRNGLTQEFSRSTEWSHSRMVLSRVPDQARNQHGHFLTFWFTSCSMWDMLIAQLNPRKIHFYLSFLSFSLSIFLSFSLSIWICINYTEWVSIDHRSIALFLVVLSAFFKKCKSKSKVIRGLFWTSYCSNMSNWWGNILRQVLKHKWCKNQTKPDSLVCATAVFLGGLKVLDFVCWKTTFYFGYSSVEKTLLSYTSVDSLLFFPLPSDQLLLSWFSLVEWMLPGPLSPLLMLFSSTWAFKQFLLTSSDVLKIVNTKRFIGPMLEKC